MKIKILYCIAFVTGALLISATNGFSYNEYGDTVNTVCNPVAPYAGNDCVLCHVADRGASTPAKTAYLGGVPAIEDFFCPTATPPVTAPVTPPTGKTWAACTPEQIGPAGNIVRVRVINCNVNPAGTKNGWMTLSTQGTSLMMDVILAAMTANKGIAIAFDGSTDAGGYNYATAVIFKK